MKKFAVVLSGCGHLDGSEIHESVMTLLAISRNNCTYTIFAPDANQYHVMNHLSKETVEETRHVMVETARIARGEVSNITEYNPADFDALIFPGGFGVAKNLFTYFFDGVQAKVNPDVERAIKETYLAKKPIGALCIAPVLLAKVLKNITITVGSDPGTIAHVEEMGATHINTKQTEVIADKQNMIFSTPCYMLPATIADIADSADNLICSILENIE